VQEIEGPANGLTVWEQKIEVIETEFLLAIKDAGHQAMNGQRRNRGALPGTSCAEDRVHGSIVIYCVDQDTEDISFAGITHCWAHRSLLNSKISCKIC